MSRFFKSSEKPLHALSIPHLPAERLGFEKMISEISGLFQKSLQTSLLPSRAFERVIPSEYSISPPIGIP